MEGRAPRPLPALDPQAARRQAPPHRRPVNFPHPALGQGPVPRLQPPGPGRSSPRRRLARAMPMSPSSSSRPSTPTASSGPAIARLDGHVSVKRLDAAETTATTAAPIASPNASSSSGPSAPTSGPSSARPCRRGPAPREAHRDSLPVIRGLRVPEADLHPRQGRHKRRLSGFVRQVRQPQTPRNDHAPERRPSGVRSGTRAVWVADEAARHVPNGRGKRWSIWAMPRGPNGRSGRARWSNCGTPLFHVPRGHREAPHNMWWASLSRHGHLCGESLRVERSSCSQNVQNAETRDTTCGGQSEGCPRACGVGTANRCA